MNMLESLFLDSIFILFPLFSYFLFVINERNLGRKTSDILFDLALFSALYLMLKYNAGFIAIGVMFLVIPLLIAYLRKKTVTTIIFSLTIGYYYSYYFKIDVIYILMEFTIYFLMFYIFNRKNIKDTTAITIFVIMKIVFIALELNYFMVDDINGLKEILILPFIFYVVTHLIYFLMVKSEKIMSLHLSIKEIEEEKQLRDTLFKITHEIKNPLAVCKGYLDMFDASNKDHIKRYIPIIRQEIERTLALMADYMNLAKLKVEIVNMDVSVLLQDISEIASLMLRDKKIEYIPTLIDEEVYIEGDYNRLKQVFLNVIKNAVEAIEVNDKGIIKIDVKVNRNNIVIAVSDNGIGMSQDAMQKIGEAFYTTKSNGTGLGVKLSKEIIDAHNGRMEYKSKSNVGTTVTITLPVKKSF